jgi:DNA-binding winged helix-turn-helix (wHTH) protein/dipeptidyl aminopeptidase/acylaminoacyl peptidase
MPARKVYRFGVFDLDGRTGELRKHGIRLRLRGKPLQILQILLEAPGQVVTREELQQRLWPSDVFVDFDSGLNTAANRLRLALGDSAENPRYIETLARTGYRFIAPVDAVDINAATTTPIRARRWARAALAAAAIVAASGVGAWFALRAQAPIAFQFRQITFRLGQVGGARFAPDGQTILYTATWDQGPPRLFLTHPSSPESRALGFDDRRLVSISRTGELALLSSDGTLPIAGSTLSRVPMNGGAPLDVERNIMSADWSADGTRLAISRAVAGVNQLEFPIGNVLLTTAGWISSIRTSPDGARVAFVEHPIRNEPLGSIRVVDQDQRVRTLSGDWANAGGLAWHPSGDEIWFTASRGGTPKSLWAVTLSGRLRSVTQIAGTMTLRDIAPDGRVLLSRDTQLLEMAGALAGKPHVTNLTWLDWSRVADISPDGRQILFDEGGVVAGSEYLVYVHRTDDGSTVRLGEGMAMALSADGRFALTRGTSDRRQLRLVPLGDGKPTELPVTGLEYQWVRYFPDGQRLLALASEPGQALRLYVQRMEGTPYPITPPTVARNVAISPDGTRIAVFTGDRRLTVYPTTKGGKPEVVATAELLAPLLWTEGDWLYVQHLGAYTQIPTRISRFHLPTGRLEPWRDIAPPDPTGVNAITKVMLSTDTRTVVFNYRRALSALFVAERATR